MVAVKLALATCQKCNANVWLSKVDGFEVVTDLKVITEHTDKLAALVAGKTLYRPHTGAQGFTWLTLSKSLDGDRYATHGCCVRAVVRATPVELAPVGPQQAPVTSGGLPGGCRPLPALASGSQGRTEPRRISPFPTAKINRSNLRPRPPAARASLRPSRPTRCRICNEIINGEEQGIVAVQHGNRMVWAEHVEH